VTLVLLGRLVPSDLRVPRGKQDSRAIPVQLDLRDSQELLAFPDHLVILEVQAHPALRVLVALLEIVAVRDFKVFRDLLDSLEHLETQVRLDQLVRWASEVCKDLEAYQVTSVQSEVQASLAVQVHILLLLLDFTDVIFQCDNKAG